MCNKELLVAYVYDDISDIDRGRFERHLRECAACRDEAAAMRSVRADLASWTPPEPDLGFSIVQRPRASWRAMWWTPAFGLAAAAVLVLAAAAALAHVEVTYGATGFAVRTGWNRSAAVSSTPAAGDPAASRAAGDAQSARLEASIAEITRRVRELEGTRATPVQTVSNTAPRLSDAEILRRVSDLLARSESRQQQELALRIAQVIRDVEAQRVADLARIQQGFGRIDAMTTAEAASHRDLANYILTSSKQQK